MFACNYAKGVEQTWVVTWICINVLMHVHILIKVWDQQQGDWDTLSAIHEHPGFHVTMQSGVD